MKGTTGITVEALARLSLRDVEETLLLLWENGLDDVKDADETLVGGRLNHAKHVLGVPGASQLTSLKYWQRVLGLSEAELRELIQLFGLSISSRARKLPNGAIRKLKAETIKRKIVLQPLPMDEPVQEMVVSAERVKWKTIGKEMEEIVPIDVHDILKVHFALVKDFVNNNDPINPSGPRDLNLLESALFRQETRIGDKSKYESVEMRGAALLHSLIHNHPFHNGNKRTALVSLLVFLDNNQLMLTCSQDDLFRFVLIVAQHRIVKEKFEDLADREVLAIANWIFENSRSVKLGDRMLSFRKCKQLLNKYGCEISHSDGGTNFKITRKIKGQGIFGRTQTLISHVSLRNEGEDLQIRTVKKIRQDLKLDEENGIDSAAFYDNVPTAADEFIIRYRKILLRLAKL